MLRLIFILLMYACCASAHAQSAVETACVDSSFTISAITPQLAERMQGGSWTANNDIRLDELRYLRVLHVDFDGNVKQGELVCNAAIAEDLIDIFRQLYQARYPIARMTLIDDFGANDEQSMRANNTSCFCYRKVAGSRTLSRHALGLAIDINPLQNPCVWTRRDGRRVVEPATATPYIDRSRSFAGKIAEGDLCLRLFLEHGFRWGGAWRTKKDYQHFEKSN